jgi:hypothetical protein
MGKENANQTMSIGNDKISNTPETDAEIKIELTCACYPNEYVSGDFARKLERERDEAREDAITLSLNASRHADELEQAKKNRDDLQKAVNGLCDHFGVSPANTTLLAVEVLKIKREREEAIAALVYIAHSGLSARHLEDYAKEVLRKLK